MPTSHSSSHTFNSFNNTHQEKIITSTTYSWDVKNTHDLIDSSYFQDYLNTFDYYSINANSTHVCRITKEFLKIHVKK
jgi:hypothetical protein